MPSALHARCTNLLLSLGLASPGDEPTVSPLTGGVASDIALVEFGERSIVLKFPLAKLDVAQDWYAPVGRNRTEYGWLEFAGGIVAGCAPRVLGRDDTLNGFAMEFVQGDDVYLWKTALLERHPIAGEAAKTGDALGRIHAASTLPGFASGRFQNQDDFDALRLEPYFAFTAGSYPDLEDAFEDVIRETRSNSPVLIHGDVSPKNILFRAGRPVFLDAECATMGDPGFDVAFCINHLVLKSFHMPDRADELMVEARHFWDRYARHVDWEETAALEPRICRLLPALMLARLDGRSPVKYLSEGAKQTVRAFAKPLLANPLGELDGILSNVATSMNR